MLLSDRGASRGGSRDGQRSEEDPADHRAGRPEGLGRRHLPPAVLGARRAAGRSSTASRKTDRSRDRAFAADGARLPRTRACSLGGLATSPWRTGPRTPRCPAAPPRSAIAARPPRPRRRDPLWTTVRKAGSRALTL